MSYIKSRPHSTATHALQLGVAAAAIALPIAAHAAEQTPAKSNLPEVQVKAQGDNEYKASKAASAKYTQPLVDTPQTITVIKRELIEQQNAQTLTDALRNAPGVGAFFLGENGSTNTGDAVYMRGFDASSSIYVDGIRDLGSISRDLFNIEQIDVLKGNAGTDTGRSAPTGSINLSSKQAGLENANNASITVGSARQKRVTADTNIVLDESKGAAFRLNAMVLDSGVPGRDTINNKRWAIAPSLAYGLGSDTRFFLNYLHVQQNNIPDGGVPTIGLPGYTSPDPKRPFLSNAAPVSSSNFYGLNSDFDKVQADMLTGKIEKDFSATSKLTNITRYGRTTQNYLLTSFMGSATNWLTPDAGNPASWTLARSIRTLKDQSNEILTNQTNWQYSTRIGGYQHDLLSGVELTSEKQNTWGYSGTGTPVAANLYHPNPADAVAGLNLVRNGVVTRGNTSTVSAYVFDTMKLSEQWQLNGGIRIDRYNTDYDATSLSTASSNPNLPVNTLVPTALSTSGNLLNWKLGALYKPTSFSSVYVSASTSKQPPGGSNFALSTATNTAANPGFDPQEVRNYEIGTKWDLLKEKLSFTAAVYRTNISNEVVQNLADLMYYQTGGKRVEGLELGLTGALNRDWLISAGYARMNTSVTAGPMVTANGLNNLAYAPKQAFTAWTSYQVNRQWKVGGGARFVDALMRGTDGAVGTPASTESYWVFDAMTSYTINKNLDVQLNVSNLTDKTYVAAINKSGFRYTPGTPRAVSLTINLKF